MKNNMHAGTHVVVQAHYPAWTQEQVDRTLLRLNNLVPDGVVSFIVENAEGTATVFSGPGAGSVPPFDVAAAVAHLKRRCGWDESNPICIRIGAIEIPIWFH